MTPSKPQRWLDLLAVLIGHRYPVPVDQLLESVPAYRERWMGGDETARKSVRRMFERDKDELRRLGIPLETRPCQVRGREAEGYRIAPRDFYLPYLHLLGTGSHPPSESFESVTLSEDDARVAIRALREVLQLPSFPFPAEARTALRKLTFDLDPALTESAAAGGETLRVLDRPGGADPKGALGALLDGLYHRQRVGFRYHSISRDAIAAREVEPWGLLYQHGGWYLVGRDSAADLARSDNGSPRLFRVDRMSDARRLRTGATRPEFEVPTSFDLRDYANRKAWHFGGDPEDEIPVDIRFRPPASLLAVRNRWGTPIDESEDGTVVRRFTTVRMDPLLRWVLSQAGEAEVISPPEAVDRIRGMARNILQKYGAGSR